MKLIVVAALAPAAFALSACEQEQQAPDGAVMTVDETEDALATDTAILPPQDTSGQAPAGVATPTPEPTSSVEPLPETDPDIRT